MGKEKQIKYIKKNILEIRYDAEPTFFDVQGSLINNLKKDTGLKKWSMTGKRIDLFNEDKSIWYFVSFHNLGALFYSSPTDNFFIDKIIKFIKNISLSQYKVNRIGIREIYCLDYEKNILKLKEDYNKIFLLPEKVKNILNNDLMSSIFYFKDKNPSTNYKIITSIFEEKKEILNTFLIKYEDENTIQKNNIEELPNKGLVIDVDVWQEHFNQKNFNQEINILLKNIYNKGINKRKEILNLFGAAYV